jgi:flagellar M-ring protein FliF
MQVRWNFFAQLLEQWGRLTPNQKAAMGLAILLLATVTFVVVTYATAPTYAQLYGNMSPEDAAAVVAKLKAQKIPYRLANDGSAVEIPQKHLDDVRLDLASEGLPRGGNSGFELFDKTQLGESEFGEQLRFTRALQGELERTISHLESVTDSRVHLALPERRLFATDAVQPSASVELTLARATPTAREVRAIVHLVASAVPGLTPDRVTVIDTRGNLLSDMAGVLDNGTRSTQAEMERVAELALEKRLQNVLDRVLGANKAVLTASIRMSFDKAQIETENYSGASAVVTATQDPRGVLETERRVSEVYGGGRGAPATGVTPPAGAAGQGYTHSENATTYRVPRRVERREVAPGQVVQTKLAVMLDSSVPADQVPNLKTTLAAAAGIDAARIAQDVAVTQLAFNTEQEKAAAAVAAKTERTQFIFMIAKYAGAGLLVLIFLFILRSLYRGMAMGGTVTATVPAITESSYALDAPNYPKLATPEYALEQYSTVSTMPLDFEEPEAPVEDVAVRRMDPTQIAKVIKGLMEEEKSA